MKKHLSKSYPELPNGWTIMRQEGTAVFRKNHSDESGKRTWWYAFNTLNGDRKPARESYDLALKDVPQSPYSEPWGV